MRLRLEPLRQLADVGPVAANEASDVQQQKILQRCNARRLCRILREALETAEPVAKVRQCLIVCFRQIVPAHVFHVSQLGTCTRRFISHCDTTRQRPAPTLKALHAARRTADVERQRHATNLRRDDELGMKRLRYTRTPRRATRSRLLRVDPPVAEFYFLRCARSWFSSGFVASSHIPHVTRQGG